MSYKLHTAPRRTAGLARRPSVSRGTNNEWTPLKLNKVIASIALTFVLLGLIFTYSSSSFESTAYFKRQLIFDMIGIGLALFLSQTFNRLIKIKIFQPHFLLIYTWILLIVVLVFAREQANVHRWIDLKIFKLQPSEIAKMTLVIYVANYLEKYAGKLASNWKLLLKPIIVAGITLGLILAEKDFGTPTLMGGVFGIMLIVAGAQILHLAVPVVVLSPLIIHQLFFVGYRRARIFSFLNPFANEGSTGYQLTRSFLAVGSGGWFGKGMGNSELKLQYLPAAHTDFIFSVMCEEIGMFALLIVIGFCWLLVCGVSLAKLSKTYFRSLVILGLTSTICLQAFFNMAMAIGLLPTKGIALPFFSYGGSSVIMTLAMIGIILNMAALDNTTPTPSRRETPVYKQRKRI